MEGKEVLRDLPAKKHAVFHYVPKTLVPYAELFRLHTPVGSLYVYFPCLFGTLFLSALPSAPPISSPRLLLVNLIFLVGAFQFHGLGCTWNDILDRDLDRQVSRTRNRPLARGAISVYEAVLFAVFQLLLGIMVHMILLPIQTILYSIPPFLLAFIYPVTKRFMSHPQLVLGFTFSCGVSLAIPALYCQAFISQKVLIGMAALFLANVTWTIFYDTIYALQDLKDDLRAGINSSAVSHVHRIKYFLATVATAQVFFLCATGLAVHLPLIYYVGTCGGTSITLAATIWKVDVQNPQDCFWWHKHHSWLVAFTISSGFLGASRLFVGLDNLL